MQCRARSKYGAAKRVSTGSCIFGAFSHLSRPSISLPVSRRLSSSWFRRGWLSSVHVPCSVRRATAQVPYQLELSVVHACSVLRRPRSPTPTKMLAWGEEQALLLCGRGAVLALGKTDRVHVSWPGQYPKWRTLLAAAVRLIACLQGFSVAIQQKIRVPGGLGGLSQCLRFPLKRAAHPWRRAEARPQDSARR